MKFAPIRMSSIQETIYEQLLNAIVSGQIEPGARLTLDSISKQFNVSIMPVREAFRKLEAIKLVKRDKNRAISVTELSAQNIEEIVEVRLILECHLASYAATKCSSETLRQLESLQKSMAATKVASAYLKLNRDFHFTLYKEAGRPIQTEIVNSLWERYSPYLFIVYRENRRWPVDPTIGFHLEMLKGMQHQDADRVTHWLTADLRQSANTLLAAIRTRDAS